MIFQPPFYRPSYFYNNGYRKNYINNYQYNQPNTVKTKNFNEVSDQININSSSSDTRKNNDTNEFIEIFGIKLFFDDILILCLLFFLYKQDINDPLLFVALLLLLLS